MTISETDVELLETYLDESLSEPEVGALMARLVVEPGLALALDELRAERSMRAAVWRAIEPDQVTADRLTWRVQGAMVAQNRAPKRMWSQWQLARTGSAAAACLVVGFFVGWARHGQAVGPAAPMGDSAVAVNQNTTPVASSNAGLLVPVTNEYGQVVAWQPFGNSNDAKNFTEDLHRARVPASSVPSDVRLTADEEPVRVKF